MTDFYLKEGDTSPSITATLQDAAGNAVDLTQATEVKFHMALRPEPGEVHGTAKVSADADKVDATNGEVRYDWAATDTDTPGIYDAEWRVTWTGGRIESFPQDGYRIIEIKERLAP